MGNLTGKERTVIGILAAAAAAAILYSWDRLLADGILSWGVRQREYLSMAGETGAVFVLLVLALRCSPSSRVRAAGVVGILAVFLWAHRAFWAVAVSGLYMTYLWGMGRWLLGKIQGRGRPGAGKAEEFLTGSVLTVVVFCLMSALGVGRILYLWMFVAVSAAAVAADEVICRRHGKGGSLWGAAGPGRYGIRAQETPGGYEGGRWKAGLCFLWAGVLTFFCIQAGRMNIAVDFDSLWYGVRSPYILDNGRGIYENMGTIGIVYTYSKGFEVLTLPLSVLPSYSFAIGFNLWLLAVVLRISGRIVRLWGGGGTAGPAVCFLASIPGIMNMGITAKSDAATLCFQMIMLYQLLLYLKGDRQALWYGLGAFFFSWTMKPTALVFSTVIMGMSVVYFGADRLLGREKSGRETGEGRGAAAGPDEEAEKDKRQGGEKAAGKAGGIAALVLSLLSLSGIWARTFRITGLPVTSVFSSILTKLGFRMKYPFNVQKIPNSSAGVPVTQWIKDMAKRVWGVLFNPQGPDMDHVILAWGSLAVWFLLCVCGACLILDRKDRSKEERRLDGYLNAVFWPFAGCCVVSLLLLTQVDGNYFMLFYVLLTLFGFRLLGRLSGENGVKAILALSVPVMLFSGIVMTLTNWSWTTGFTPVSWRHRGYYDHQKEQHRRMEETGNGQIWDILAADPRNRLIAVGEHPQVLAFPCSAQSYADITGTWGNVVLVKYMDNFVEFMRYGETDYVYAQAGYMGEEERAWSLTCDLIEYGVLVPVCYEQGNMLARVDTQGQRTDSSVEYLKEFLEEYRRKE